MLEGWRIWDVESGKFLSMEEGWYGRSLCVKEDRCGSYEQRVMSRHLDASDR